MVEIKMKKSWSDSVLENRKYELFFLFLFPTKCVLNIYEKKKKPLCVISVDLTFLITSGKHHHQHDMKGFNSNNQRNSNENEYKYILKSMYYIYVDAQEQGTVKWGALWEESGQLETHFWCYILL